MGLEVNGRKSLASFAVIRSYQPTRIERQLLAQVFELAGRGSDTSNADESQLDCDVSQAAVANKRGIPQPFETRGAEQEQRVVLEAVA